MKIKINNFNIIQTEINVLFIAYFFLDFNSRKKKKVYLKRGTALNHLNRSNSHYKDHQFNSCL
jgi:hypothetical protein